MTASAAQAFHDELVAHRILVDAGPLGAYGRGPVFERILDGLDAILRRHAQDTGVPAVQFPPVMDRMIVERTGYMDGFPNLLGAIHSFTGNEREARALGQRIAEGQPWGDALGATDVVLCPAACYPFYPTCRGTIPPEGHHVTLVGWVYRQEPSIEPTRLRAFQVREFVRVGAPEVMVAWRDEWIERGLAILADLQLPATHDLSADPFFGRGGKILAAGQIEQRLKFEISVPVIPGAEPTACASFNYHQDKFGSAFGITLPSGETAHSACIGFGLERVVFALLKTHGFDPARWPASVRARLWP